MSSPPSPPATTRRAKAFSWLMTAAWAGLIFYLSTETFGVGFTGWLLHELLHLLHLHVSKDTFNVLHHLMRKSAHATEYGFFSAFIYRSLSPDVTFRWQPRVALESVLLAAGYSLTDEFHQLFESGRTSSLVDSGIDTAGAGLALALIYLVGRITRGGATVESAAEPT